MAEVGSLTTQQLRRVVTLAARAPSGDNTQPWTFSWDGQILTVIFHPGKARHVLDAGLSGAKISLGCVIESLSIAASELAFGIDCQYLQLSEDSPGGAARVTFFKDGRKPDRLLDAIEKRNTDRRLFQKGAMPSEELKEVWKQFEGRDDVGVHCAESIDPGLFEYLVAAESLVTKHPKIFPDTLPWIRVSEEEIRRTEDGMPWRGVGVNAFQYPFIRFVRAVPSAFPWVSRAGMGKSYGARVKQLLRSSAGLFCLSARNKAELILMDTGRLAMRLWLRLTQLGYGVQPLTLSSLLLYNAKIGVLDADSMKLFGKRYAEGESILRKAFSIPTDNLPVWLFRTGRSSPLPARWFTLRRSLE